MFSLGFLLVVDLNNDLVLDTSLIHGLEGESCLFPKRSYSFWKGPSMEFSGGIFWGGDRRSYNMQTV